MMIDESPPRRSHARILLVSLSNIGDAILTTPVLEALHRQWPAAAITVLAGPRAVPLFERDPRVVRVMAYEPHRSVWAALRFITELRRQRFDVVVDLRHSAIPLLIGARFRSPMIRWRREGGHRIETHLVVVRRMGVSTEGITPRVLVGPEDVEQVRSWLAELPAERPWMAMAPGARSHLKRWTVEGFVRVAETLAVEDGVQIILVGDQEDRLIADQVVAGVRRGVPPVNWAGRTTLRQLAVLFQRVRLVVTNDSACLHLATAAGTPVVALFGPTDPVKYGPFDSRDRIVRLGLVCSPCERALCPYDHECLRWLPAREVLAAVRSRLGQEPTA